MQSVNEKLKAVKDFNGWNEAKKRIDASERSVEFHEREIWWCSIGVNVGSEQHSQTEDFSRPVLVIRKFTRDIFWGIPLTTRVKPLNFRKRLVLNGKESDLLILQMRAYDRKRLIRKIIVVPKREFAEIVGFIRDLLV